MPKSYCCALCGISNVKDRRPLKLPAIKKYVAKVLGREVGDTEVLCNKCRASYYRSLKIPASCTQSKDNTQRNHEDDDPEYCVNPEQSNANPLSPKTIQLNIPSTHSSHKYCVVCRKKSSQRVRLCVIPLSARIHKLISLYVLHVCYIFTILTVAREYMCSKYGNIIFKHLINVQILNFIE